jgi:hypothetical protein
MAALSGNFVDKDMLADMDVSDWSQMNIKVGEKKVVMKWLHSLAEARRDANRSWYTVADANFMYNVASWVGGIAMHVPAVVIGLYKDFDEDLGDDYNSTTAVLIPGLILALVTMIALGMFRLALGKDLLEEASSGTSMKEVQRSNLTNTGVVGALLLTVVVAMVQENGPFEDNQRFLCQWYTVFNLIGMLWCFAATTLSVLLLMYIEPLDEESSLIFVCNFLDYVGEPVGCILMVSVLLVVMVRVLLVVMVRVLLVVMVRDLLALSSHTHAKPSRSLTCAYPLAARGTTRTL